MAQTSRVPRWRPRPGAHLAQASKPGQDASLPSTTGTASPASPDSPILTEEYRDEFERSTLGADWHLTAERWSIDNGRLCGQSAKNHPVWLNRRLPTNARITYVARSLSPEGDLKVEAWGDGQSYATGASYSNATSYIFIFGGWKNQLHVLARLNEHGTDRLSLELSDAPTDSLHARTEPNRDYAFTLERRNGRTLSVSVDGKKLFAYDDPSPLSGPSHDHFGFNNWETRVCFDHLVITPLAE